MKLKSTLIATALLIIGIVAIVWRYFATHSVSLLQPKGYIASEQYKLLVFASILSVIVIIPVFTMLLVFAWRYRESNTKATYRPNWDSSRLAEAVWWGIPIIIIGILSVVTWRSTYALDPYKPLSSSMPAVNVQVVALQWKWLFIYPDYGVASVNYLPIPEKTPISFAITSDAPMNSFWIPDLCGQIYAMSGMQTRLHLMADGTGTYRGSSANISGEGFASMDFTAESMTTQNFEDWMHNAQHQDNTPLTETIYAQLAQPSVPTETQTFSSVQPGLYTTIIHKYMNHSDTANTSQDMTNMEHHH